MNEPVSAAIAARNLLLANLPPAELQALIPYLQPVQLELTKGIFEAGEPIESAYFPFEGLLSIVSPMNDGSQIEVAAVGREGAVGTSALLGQTAIPYRCFVQIEGSGLRIGVDTLRAIADRRPDLRQHLLRYQGSLMVLTMQNVACNGLHQIQQRCCRWLLLTRDRQRSDTFGLTHEFLGQMLGVRRASVSEVLKPLRDQGLVDYTRGQITILNAAGLEACACECYRVIADEFSWLQ